MPAEMSRRWERILDSRSSDLLFAESPRTLLKATEVGLAPGTQQCLGKGGEGVTVAQKATYLEDLSIAFKRHEQELEQRNWVQFPSLIRAGPVRMSHDTRHGDSSQPLPNRLLPADTYNVSPGWRSSWELLNEQGTFRSCLRSQPQSCAWYQAELMLTANMHI